MPGIEEKIENIAKEQLKNAGRSPKQKALTQKSTTRKITNV